MNKYVTITSLLISISLFGGVSGWLVGSSNTPVVSAFLPLMFGVMTYIVSNVYFSNLYSAHPKPEAEATENRQQDHKALININNALSCEVLLIAALVLSALSMSTYYGVRLGIKERNGEYASYLGMLNYGNPRPSPDVAAAALRVVNSMRSSGVNSDDYDAVTAYSLKYIMSNPLYGDAEKVMYLNEIAKAFVVSSASSTYPMRGRGPASQE